MKYYRRQDNQVFAFADDGSQDKFIPVDSVLMTDLEIAAHLAPPPETAELRRFRLQAQLDAADAKSVRALRELLLDQAGLKNLTGLQRAAARQRLRDEDDAADTLRAQL
jgi:hypothetical protein